MLAPMRNSRSPKGHASILVTHPNNQSTIIQENATPHPDKLRVEHEKLHHLQSQITEMFLELRSCTIDEVKYFLHE